MPRRSRSTSSAALALAIGLGLCACSPPGAGGWRASSVRPKKTPPRELAIVVRGLNKRSAEETLYECVRSGLRGRGYAIAEHGAPRRWVLGIDVTTFDTLALYSQRRIYVEMSVIGVLVDGTELFKLDLARTTHPLAGSASAKVHAHLIELCDAIVYAIPKLAE